MNFTIGWVIGAIAIALAVITAVAWVSAAYSQRRQAQRDQQ